MQAIIFNGDKITFLSQYIILERIDILTRQEQQKNAKSSENKQSSQTANSENNNNVRSEIEKLTEQIVALRNELEDLRQSRVYLIVLPNLFSNQIADSIA